MKLTHKLQVIISVVMIIIACILTDVFDYWLYRSIGYVICGLIWIIHPVVPNGMEVNKQTIFWTRVGGAILILIGVFTRTYHF